MVENKDAKNEARGEKPKENDDVEEMSGVNMLESMVNFIPKRGQVDEGSILKPNVSRTKYSHYYRLPSWLLVLKSY